VAVLEELGHRIVGIIPGRIGVAHYVEPMPSPPLRISWRGQKPVDDFWKCRRRRVGLECLNLLGRWRQASQIESDSADQRKPISRADGVYPFRLQTGEDKTIHRISRPSRLAHGGNGRVSHRPESPMIFASLDNVDILGFEIPGLRPWSAAFDPCGKG